MKKSEILKLDCEKIDDEVFEKIMESTCVDCVENLGRSCLYSDCNWYDVQFTDGSNMDVYLVI